MFLPFLPPFFLDRPDFRAFWRSVFMASPSYRDRHATHPFFPHVIPPLHFRYHVSKSSFEASNPVRISRLAASALETPHFEPARSPSSPPLRSGDEGRRYKYLLGIAFFKSPKNLHLLSFVLRPEPGPDPLFRFRPPLPWQIGYIEDPVSGSAVLAGGRHVSSGSGRSRKRGWR